MNLSDLHAALSSGHLEIARRIGRALVTDPATCTTDAVFGLHDALAALTDFREASNLLAAHGDLLKAEPFAVVLRLAEDAEVLSVETHYRLSDEAKVGLTIDEYLVKYRALADERFAEAIRLADSPAHLSALRAAAARCKRKLPADLASPPALSPLASHPSPATGSLPAASSSPTVPPPPASPSPSASNPRSNTKTPPSTSPTNPTTARRSANSAR